MKTLIIATAGALALTSTAAFAQSAYVYGDDRVVIESEAPRAGYAGESIYYSPSPAQGLSPQADTEAKASTPNMGAGTSRSNAANNG